MVFALCQYGVAWWAVPCSTFIFLSMGSTGRRYGSPEGNPHVLSVRQANALFARVCVLCALCAIRQVYFIIEQPASSMPFVLQSFLRLRQSNPVVRGQKLKRHHMWMGALGHALPKPTVLWGCYPEHLWAELRTRRPTHLMMQRQHASKVRTTDGTHGPTNMASAGLPA